MTLLEFSDEMEALHTKWQKVEEYIKEAEIIQNGQVIIPSINELRYAGRQIIRALSLSREIENPEVDKQYKSAIACANQYLLNAEHDVADSMVMYIGMRVNDINLRFGRQAVIEAYPPYEKLCQVLENSRSKIKTSRRDNSQRKNIYDELRSEYIPNLIGRYDDLLNSDLFMSAQFEKINGDLVRAQYKNSLLKITVSVMSVILAVIIFFAVVRIL